MKHFTLFSNASDHAVAALAIATLLLSACSSQPLIQTDKSAQKIIRKQPPIPQNLPEVELSGKLLFDILVAEFAEDSGKLSVANKKVS